MNNIIKLDLGCGSKPRPGFIGVDIAQAAEGVITLDLTSGNKWPWKDSSINELSSSHFIEHIAADYVRVCKSADGLAANLTPATADGTRVLVGHVMKDRLLFFFDEAFRIIKPGGLFHLEWPALQSTDAFRDPTHRRFIPLEMLYYLSRESRDQMGLQHYEASCNWVVLPESVQLSGEGFDFEAPNLGYVGLEQHRHFWNVQRAWSVTLKAEK